MPTSSVGGIARKGPKWRLAKKHKVSKPGTKEPPEEEPHKPIPNKSVNPPFTKELAEDLEGIITILELTADS